MYYFILNVILKFLHKLYVIVDIDSVILVFSLLTVYPLYFLREWLKNLPLRIRGKSLVLPHRDCQDSCNVVGF